MSGASEEIWIVYTGWTGATAECYFIQATCAAEAVSAAAQLFSRDRPGRRFSGEAQKLELNRLSECEGF